MQNKRKAFALTKRSHRPLLAAISVLMLQLAPVTIAANARDFEEDSKKEWQELPATLPAAPKAENLMPFYDSGSQSFALDAASLSIADDGSIRYTLVSTSSAGAKNISYEAIRCLTAEKKLYAFGRSDGSWSPSRRDQWDKISDSGVNKQHSTLFYEYFCDGKSIAGKVEQIITRIKRKQPMKQY
jgi:hypothetical protein